MNPPNNKTESVNAVPEATTGRGCSFETMIVTDSNGNIVETSSATEHTFGMPAGALRGRNIHDLLPIPGYDDLLRQTDGRTRIWSRPIILKSETGKQLLVNLSVQRVGEGDAQRFVHVFQDCTDLRTMEQRLLQSERLATVGKFASQVAHEIRNPLSSISLNLELLQDELDGESKEADNLIRAVLRELDRLNDIVGDYLRFARFRKPSLQRGHVDKVIQDVAADFKPKDGVKLEVALMPSSPEIWLDENLFRQALDNLLRNGVEAIEGSGTVRIETEIIDRFLVVRVKDTGCGIPAELQQKLFEPFCTTKPQGTGLGLVTTQQIIFEHNGHLLVESNAGQGTTFTTLLPL